jgi:adenine-specific DNA methylase
MKAPLAKQLQALPSYFGGKRRLLSWIGQTLNKAVPVEHWKNLTFIDLFMGGAAVSQWAKAQGFQQVIANDISHRSQILAQGFLTNHRIQLSKSDTLWLTQPLPEPVGFIESTYCPEVFSMRHARALDQGFYWASQHPDPVKQALLLVIMWHLSMDFVAFATSLGSSNRPFAEALDGLRSWDVINPKRFHDGSLKRLCELAWSRLEEKRRLVNGGVYGGASVTAYQADALDLLPNITGDILYLDPPYAGTVSYEQGNKVLDALLQGHKPPSIPIVSEFSKSTDVLNQLFQKAQHIPIWLLSYGNTELSLAELTELVSAHAQDRVVKGFAKTYQHMPHVSQRHNNQELLILAYPKEK